MSDSGEFRPWRWLPALTLTGCDGPQSALAPRGPGAQAVAEVWWLMFGGALLILLAVMVLAVYGYARGSDDRPAVARRLIVGGGLILPVAVLSALVLYGHRLGARLTSSALAALEIEVVGHRFWWEVRYPGGAATANELRLPAGRAVTMTLRSEDVIHSFWLPNLAGKLDLVPGHVNRLTIQADRPGLWRGQCAEFCGRFHADMELVAIAHPPEEFEAWLREQRQPAGAPRSAEGRAGERAFLALGCAACHRIRGGAADGRGGPDLTHAAGRARRKGVWPPTRPQPQQWIVDSHRTVTAAEPQLRGLDPATVAALARYLEELR